MAAAEEAKKPEVSSNGKLGKLVLPIVAILNLGGVGFGASLAYKGTLGYKPPVLGESAALEEMRKGREAETGTEHESVLYTMPPFTVNLAGNPGRIVRLEMTFEMLDKDGFEDIVRNSPHARDQVMRYLNERTFDDIESIQGKLALKDGIAVALNQSLKSGVVKDIYFGEFLVSNKSPVQ
jgi:flagellar FliL protein